MAAGIPDIRDMATRPVEVYYTLNMGIAVEEAAGNRKNRVPGADMVRLPEGCRYGPPHCVWVSNLKDNRTFQGGAGVVLGPATTIGHTTYSVGKHGLGM